MLGSDKRRREVQYHREKLLLETANQNSGIIEMNKYVQMKSMLNKWISDIQIPLLTNLVNII